MEASVLADRMVKLRSGVSTLRVAKVKRTGEMPETWTSKVTLTPTTNEPTKAHVECWPVVPRLNTGPSIRARLQVVQISQHGEASWQQGR